MYGWGIARRLLVIHYVFVVVLTLLAGTAAFVEARDRGFTETADRMLSVAAAMAGSPLVATAARSSDPTVTLQPYSVRVMKDAHVDVISVMSPTGIRWSHPDTGEIGDRAAEETAPATDGVPFTDIGSGPSGPWVRAVVPVLDPNDGVVGLVAAEAGISTLHTVLEAHLPAILALALILLLAGWVTSRFLGHYLRRVTLGWGPEELAEQFLNKDAVLHSVREGLVLVDRAGTVLVCNDRAAELLGIPRHGTRAGSACPAIADLGLAPGLAELLASGRSVRDEVHRVGARTLLISQEPAVPTSARVRSRAVGLATVTTIREAPEAAATADEGSRPSRDRANG
ncbi:PAS domain-containing protein [Cryobacterium sp.]|jgi:sensor histidine kinase regulating citrate/malate metabolism|uniref:PAS domain-containing protein n=1 Tax=Cryobacterium sp. TaxID=1926290 RepID=UPI0026293326|nr:PAS domain-containing protein [Cryobacterium sp.]MCU1447063.1 Histidine kinase [Cryobacterium sp.]